MKHFASLLLATTLCCSQLSAIASVPTELCIVETVHEGEKIDGQYVWEYGVAVLGKNEMDCSTIKVNLLAPAPADFDLIFESPFDVCGDANYGTAKFAKGSTSASNKDWYFGIYVMEHEKQIFRFRIISPSKKIDPEEIILALDLAKSANVDEANTSIRFTKVLRVNSTFGGLSLIDVLSYSYSTHQIDETRWCELDFDIPLPDPSRGTVSYTEYARVNGESVIKRFVEYEYNTQNGRVFIYDPEILDAVPQELQFNVEETEDDTFKGQPTPAPFPFYYFDFDGKTFLSQEMTSC